MKNKAQRYKTYGATLNEDHKQILATIWGNSQFIVSNLSSQIVALIEFTSKGLYCSVADVFIDPWQSVKKAFITHAHSDHARSGHGQYISTKESLPILKYRLGSFINILGVNYGEKVNINGVHISFHPAGHVIGSAQIRLEYRGEIWVVSGDYKLENDGLCTPFESVKCHTFITESTFGLPSFKWKAQKEVFEEINAWWQLNQSQGKASVITAYSLGKAQRIIQNLDPSLGKIYTHGAIENMHEVLRNHSHTIIRGLKVENNLKTEDYVGSMIIAPPSAINSSWTKKFGLFEEANASGWMAVRGIKRRRNVDKGFVLSDHADWTSLNQAIEASGAENIFVTHGYTEIFAKWLCENKYNAKVVKTEFNGDEAVEESNEQTLPSMSKP